MKNKFSVFIIALVAATAFYACKKSFLDSAPTGVLDETTLSTEKGVNKLLIAAYAMLDGHDADFGIGGEWGSGASNFVFGSMAGGEANRGSSPGDQGGNMIPAIRHSGSASAGSLNDRWIALYEGIKRTNTVIQILAKTTGVSESSIKNITGQARFLRAWYHFQARMLWKNVPYLDEKISADLESGAIVGVANDVDIYPKIIEDVKYAYENLPIEQDAVGRANKYVAGAVYGKILMFTKDYATAKTVLTDVVNNGGIQVPAVNGGTFRKFDLNANYEDNFNVATENSPESVFAFQSSAQDNAGARNGNWGDNLNTPAGGGIGGAGFFTPTYYFTNKFKTDAAGLPAANPDNNVLLDPADMSGYTQYSGNVDTRLDWTVGRNGVPFHDWGTYQTSWRRDISSGPFASKKIMIRQAQVGAVHDASVWFSSGGTALNINLLRFADVILLLAEAEIEGGSLDNAFQLINRVRTRAQNSSKVQFPAALGTPVTKPYTTLFASQDEARNAVRLERLLELGLEGHRFFDLVRWGIATTELNAYYNYESALPYQANGDLNPKPTYAGAERDYYDIPQRQIDLSRGLLTP